MIINKNREMPTSVIIKIIEWMKPSQNILFSVALVMLTIVVTVPITVSIQSAKDVISTLDTVVVSQQRLERTLNSVFDGLDARLRIQDREIQKTKDVVIRSNEVYQKMFQDLSKDSRNQALFDERVYGLQIYQHEKWGIPSIER